MNLSELIKSSVKRYKKKIFIIERGLYRRKTYTYQKIYDQAISLCGYFAEQKIKKKDKVIIYLPNSPDYASVLWACALSGVIAVPIDFNSNKEFVEKIYRNVGGKLIICSLFNQTDFGNKIYVEQLEEKYGEYVNYKIKEKIKEEDIFEIVYTSGTTSEPKGAIITHNNLAANVTSCDSIVPIKIPDFTFLSILPLSHLLEQNVGFLLLMKHGSKIVYISSRKSSSIMGTMVEEKINGLISVPLFLSSIKEKIEKVADEKGKLESLDNAIKRFGDYPGFVKSIVFGKIKKKFPNLELFLVGGAALDDEVEKFWRAIGVEVLQGYGLTESSPILTCNTPAENKIGTVGKAIPGVEIKIKDSEIIAKGENIFQGYYKNLEETAKVIKKGYLHTGDIGKFDEDGFLILTGRKKNMILSPSGKNVYPEDIEKVLDLESGVKESVVLGLNNGKKLVAVVLSEKKINERDLLKKVNSKLSPYQYLSSIEKWSEADFPRTPTKKVIRRKVEEKLRHRTIKIEGESGDKLINILSAVCEVSQKKIRENNVLVNLGLDSLKRIDLSVKIEEAFNIDFNEDEINEKTTLKELRKSIETTKSEKIEKGLNILNSNAFIPVHYMLQTLISALSKPIFSMKIKGVENLPNEQVIFIANHSSTFDTTALLRALPARMRVKTYVAAAKDYFFETKSKYGKLMGTIGRLAYNAFSFSRTTNIKQSLKDFGEVVNRGGNVLIYPEGTRTTTGKLLPFKQGIGLLVWHMGIPVVPIKMKGLYEIMPKGKSLPSRGHVEIIFGNPIKFSKVQGIQEITDTLYKKMKEL